MQKVLYVGLDVHKASISITAGEEGRDGEVRFIDTIPNMPTDVAKLAEQLASEGRRLEFRYEAGGYRRNHLRALVQRVEVDDTEARVMGSKGCER